MKNLKILDKDKNLEINQLLIGLESLHEQLSYSVESMAFNVGAVEHLEDAVVIEGDGDPVEATDYQQELIELYRSMASGGKEPVALVGKPALESEIDEDKLSAAVTAMLVSSTHEAMRFAGDALSTTAKVFDQYALISTKLRTRLELLRTLALDQTNPVSDYNYEFGAYSRYFVHGGKPIVDFDDYNYALDWQVAVSRYCASEGKGYFHSSSDALFNCLGKLTIGADSLYQHELTAAVSQLQGNWETVWKNPEFILPIRKDIRSAFFKVPTAYAAGNSMRDHHAVAPLFDSRYLVTYEPKSKKVEKSVLQQATMVRNFGADIAFDKASGITAVGSMPLPKREQLLVAIEKCLSLTMDNEAYKPLGKVSRDASARIEHTYRILKNSIKTQNKKEVFEYALAYVKLVTSISENLNRPFTTMAWSNVRACMMTIAIAEEALIPDESKHFYKGKIFEKSDSSIQESSDEGAAKAQSFLDRVIAYFKKN